MATSILSPKSAEVLAALRSKKEATEIRDGSTWGFVYLDNARPKGTSPRAFAGHLSDLQKAGLYRIEDQSAFGWVKIADLYHSR